MANPLKAGRPRKVNKFNKYLQIAITDKQKERYDCLDRDNRADVLNILRETLEKEVESRLKRSAFLVDIFSESE